MTGPLISVRALSKSFSGPDGHPVPVLDGITLDVSEGEFVALLGRSGSGKSTLLRCIAGLIAPTSGEVLFRGKRLEGTNRDTTMVFQTFALLPWLTVQQNVEIGLEARGVAPGPRTERALRAIDLVGLDGYESAYPKELSGGMRQRVGFARALVVEPAALLMDEPFSALDVLTSENLRGELLELWEGQRFPTKTMVMVTHNIEEAVLLADRILVLGTNPGRIRADMRNPLARPRRRRTPDFEALVDHIYRMMTQRDSAPAATPARPGASITGTLGDSPLPQATVDGLSGLAEVLLGRHDGTADLADLAGHLGLEVDDLLPLVDALVLLGFAELRGERLTLSRGGRVFAGAGIQDSKEMFARAALDRAPLVRAIYRALRGSLDGNLPAGFFTDILRTHAGEEEAARQLDVAVNWGRYAELYAYDAARGQIIREEHGIGATLADLTQPVRRGTLHLYLGAAPGSGKTFTMLRDGRALRDHGEDVVVGFAQAHSRPRTAEAMRGLEIVPARQVPGGESGDPPAREEMDLDAVLARKPAVVLVDDFRWHASAIGSLRDAGIDVISTVRVYLGYAPGCGVTSAMLEEAGRRRSRGADVVVAAVDCHSREGVRAALEGLEVIGDGTCLDTGAVLARHPEVVCIDDLSAADPGGESRFAAARQLADAGITVVATVHLDNLRDGDGAAGDTLDEAAVLAFADEIELIDAPPSVLADRVRRGEIVPAAGAEHALQTDYSPETLGAKREQAFTVVAEHADRRLATYRGSGIAASSEARPRILGCAAPRPGMEPLIRRSAALAAQLAGDFLVAVVTPARAAADLDPVLAGYATLTSQLGGQFTALRGRPADALAKFAHQHQATEMVLARDPGASRHRVLSELTHRAGDAEVHVLPAQAR
ncbi:MAG: AAA-associated domain-containing protein [Streptosporangiaceae bacterium]